MKKIIFAACMLGAVSGILSQTDSLQPKKKGRGQWYGSWGYTRVKYSKSNIHLVDRSGKYHPATGKYQNYDFTLYDVTAHDRPDFKAIPDVVNITIPQFVCRIGYYFNKNTGLELNYDHAKYVMDDNKVYHIKGEIDGVYMDKDTLVDPHQFLHFEHTDGANFWMLNFIKKYDFLHFGPRSSVGFVVKTGGGIVFPRTDVTLFGEGLNNNWKVAGYIVGIESGIRAEFLKYCTFEFVAKGSHANYLNCFVLGKGNGKANHYFFAGQLTATIGFRF
jgi:hypothetical protein